MQDNKNNYTYYYTGIKKQGEHILKTDAKETD